DADLAARSERLRHEIDEATRRIADLRAACESLARELDDVRAVRIEAQGELETGRAAYQERTAQLTDVELAARELRSRGDELARGRSTPARDRQDQQDVAAAVQGHVRRGQRDVQGSVPAAVPRRPGAPVSVDEREGRGRRPGEGGRSARGRRRDLRAAPGQEE